MPLKCCTSIFEFFCQVIVLLNLATAVADVLTTEASRQVTLAANCEQFVLFLFCFAKIIKVSSGALSNKTIIEKQVLIKFWRINASLSKHYHNPGYLDKIFKIWIHLNSKLSALNYRGSKKLLGIQVSNIKGTNWKYKSKKELAWFQNSSSKNLSTLIVV